MQIYKAWFSALLGLSWTISNRVHGKSLQHREYDALLIHPKTPDDIKLLMSIEQRYAEFDLLRAPAMGTPVVAVIRRQQKNHLSRILARMSPELYTDELEQRIEMEDREIDQEHNARDRRSITRDDTVNVTVYDECPSRRHTRRHRSAQLDRRLRRWRTYEQVVTIMNELRCAYPELVTTEVVGESCEGRPIVLMKIAKSEPSDREKQKVWIQAGIHAREWISISTALYIADRLVRKSEAHAEVSYILNKYDVYILTVVNPDGYVYTHKRTDRNEQRIVYRMWRKSRCPVQSGFFGVDLNRNFAYRWSQGSSSASRDSEVYHGSSAFSEPETRAVRDAVLRIRPHLYFDLHSYSQLWLTPYAAHLYPVEEPLGPEILRVAVKGRDAMKRKHNKHYEVGAASDTIYIAGGTAMDWAFTLAQIRYSYSLELRPGPNHYMGHVIGQHQIEPVGEETWAGIMKALKAAKTPEQLQRMMV